MIKKFSVLSTIIIVLLVALDIFVWTEIVTARPSLAAILHFLDVGQGDSELALLSGGVKILTDAGPDQSVVRSIENVLPSEDRYIDLAVISHAQLDHFNGFNFLLKRYSFGAFIYNGRDSDAAPKEWDALTNALRAARIPLIALKAGDAITVGDSRVSFLSPDDTWLQSAELNDTALIELTKTPNWSALFTGDSGENVESELVKHYDLNVDILKVGHHGSKYSSGERFLTAATPKLAVIEVGERNTYGHPTKEALGRLSSVEAAVFRTDEHGTVSVVPKDGKLLIYTEK